MKRGDTAILLARYAETIFWLARYVERVENLARILDVQETFSRDMPGTPSWISVVQLYADEERFFERYNDASAANVIDFYVMDVSNLSSILSTVHMARENARTLRPLISTEMWTHLNIFYNQLRATSTTRVVPSELSRLCAVIKENCQTHTGITEGTFFRDQGWLFYELGRAIERADQTTRVVDIKYHMLLPRREDIGTITDINQWHGLLRSSCRLPRLPPSVSERHEHAECDPVSSFQPALSPFPGDLRQPDNRDPGIAAWRLSPARWRHRDRVCRTFGGQAP